MKRTTKIALAVVGVLGLALAGGVAVAQHGPEAFMKRRMSRHVDKALDAVKASDAQRTAIHAAIDNVMTTMHDNMQSHHADMQTALTLWQADKIDQTQLQALRTQHQASAKKVGDAIVQAIHDTHDALTSAQRQQLVTYLKQNKPQHPEGGRGGFMQHMISERVDDMLDQINATPAQRDTTHAAVQSVQSAFAGEDPTQHFDAAMQVFAADKIDATKVAQLQAEHQARAQKVGDAIIDAITKVHDALSPAQRAQVAEIVKSHHGHHGG